jgi:hypothetical protein
MLAAIYQQRMLLQVLVLHADKLLLKDPSHLCSALI